MTHALLLAVMTLSAAAPLRKVTVLPFQAAEPGAAPLIKPVETAFRQTIEKFPTFALESAAQTELLLGLVEDSGFKCGGQWASCAAALPQAFGADVLITGEVRNSPPSVVVQRFEGRPRKAVHRAEVMLDATKPMAAAAREAATALLVPAQHIGTLLLSCGEAGSTVAVDQQPPLRCPVKKARVPLQVGRHKVTLRNGAMETASDVDVRFEQQVVLDLRANGRTLAAGSPSSSVSGATPNTTGSIAPRTGGAPSSTGTTPAAAPTTGGPSAPVGSAAPSTNASNPPATGGTRVTSTTAIGDVPDRSGGNAASTSEETPTKVAAPPWVRPVRAIGAGLALTSGGVALAAIGAGMAAVVAIVAGLVDGIIIKQLNDRRATAVRVGVSVSLIGLSAVTIVLALAVCAIGVAAAVAPMFVN